jgi:hypothetical protein
MNERMAPGHVYYHRLGTGIQWLPGVAKLWEGGKVVAEASHTSHSPYEFWYNLAFAECFPEVTHWWFRSAWTQKVRLTKPQGIFGDGTIWGLLQFIDEQTPGQMYTITDADPPVIAVPYPPNEVQPVNLPLRIALSRLVSGVITGDIEPGKWNTVTSLVWRNELDIVCPISQASISWQLEGIETSLREALCCIQGLKPGMVIEPNKSKWK